MNHRVQNQLTTIIQKAADLKDEIDTYDEVIERMRVTLKDRQRIIDDLKEALIEQCMKPAMSDRMLAVAMAMGVAEEGSLTGRIR